MPVLTSDLMCNDTVSLVKTNGTMLGGILATVYKGFILSARTDVPFEKGDIIRRPLPNDLEDTYIISNRTFISKSDLFIPDHFLINFKEEYMKDNDAKPNQTINLTNSTIYSNSTVESHNTNVSQQKNSAEVFETVISLLQQIDNSHDRNELISLTNKMNENQCDKNKFLSHYGKFVQSCSTHASIFAAVAPHLTPFLK